MITIPTTELIGCLSAVLPIFIVPPKDNPLAGVAIEWDGEALHFTTYDVYSGATVRWVPGEGAEGTSDSDADSGEDYAWGAPESESHWRVFIGYDDAKEIVKLFKLPAKLWRYPVGLKVNATGTKLIVERDDMSRGERLLTVSTANDMLRKIPDVRRVAEKAATAEVDQPSIAAFNGLRLASLGASTAYSTAYGTLTFTFDTEDRPVGAFAGSRYAAFLYRAGAKDVHPYNILRDGADLATSN